MKKGRHRRFEEARKLKQQGPGAFLAEGRPSPTTDDDDLDLDDEFSDIAAKYGAFDDDEEDED